MMKQLSSPLMKQLSFPLIETEEKKMTNAENLRNLEKEKMTYNQSLMFFDEVFYQCIGYKRIATVVKRCINVNDV